MKPFLNKFLNIFHFRRQTAFFAVLGAVFVFSGMFFIGNYALAVDWSAEGITKSILGFIFGLIFQLLGGILSIILEVLVTVAQYNNIIGYHTVQNTWATVRDIVNMFFIFGMLLIAFSTILRYQQYEAKKMLPKLILYAVLVNFSLTICGFFIDIAQVFTLTFVNAFADNAVSNFTNITGILQYDKVDFGSAGDAARSVLLGYILALILLLVSIVVIGAFVLIFLVRILYLWILSILSPFAFVLPIIPGGQSYASQWWTMFSKQVVTAPLLAFFIWLSLTVLGGMGNISNEILNQQKLTAEGVKLDKTVMIGGSPIGTGEFLIGFIVSIGMLFVGLMLTSQMGGAAGKIAGGASNWMQRSGTGLLTGRLGPTPMRWARERYGSWRGQRESIRKEQVQRFGQGASALQDKAIGGRLQQLIGLPGNYAMRLGKWGAQKVSYSAGKNAQSGSRRERWTNKVFNAADKMEWKPGELTRERAMERVNMYEDNKKSKDQETYQKAGRLSNKDETELRTRLEKPNISRREEAAVVDTLNSKYALKQSDLGAINRTRSFLGDTLVRQKFDDLLKKTDIEVAFLSKIYRKTNAETGKEEINIDRFRSDLNQSKIDSSAITNKMFNEMDDQLIEKGAKKGAFIEQWVDEMGSSKEIKNSIGSLSRNVIDEQMKYVATSRLTEEKALAVGEGSNHWENIFNRGKDNKFNEEMAGRFFANAQNKDLFVRGHGAKFENQELFEFLHDNWLEYEFTGSQWAKMYEDTQVRESVKKIAPAVLAKINGKEENYDILTKDGYGKNRARDTIIAFNKSDKYTDKDGKLRDVYEMYDKDEKGEYTPLAQAAKKALDEQIHQGRISAPRLENMYENMVDENGNEIKVDGKPIFNEQLLSSVALFEGNALAALGKESAKRLDAVLKFMAKDAKNYGNYRAQVDRLVNNNALVHMVTEELRTLIEKSQAEWEVKNPEKVKKKK